MLAVSLLFLPFFYLWRRYFFPTDFGILFAGVASIKNQKNKVWNESVIAFIRGWDATNHLLKWSFQVPWPVSCGYFGLCCSVIIVSALFLEAPKKQSWSTLQWKRVCKLKPTTRMREKPLKQLPCFYSALHWLRPLWFFPCNDAVFREKSALYQVHTNIRS